MHLVIDLLLNVRQSALCLLFWIGFMCPAVILAQPLQWQASPHSNAINVQGNTATLTGLESQTVDLAGMPISVKPGTQIALTFELTSQNLGVHNHLILTATWHDAKGVNLDDHRQQLGFPLLARYWTFTSNHKTPITVADNLSVPQDASTLALQWMLKSSQSGKKAMVQISDAHLLAKPVEVQGIEQPDSGPADAGALSQPPHGINFPDNLVPNGALEDGQQAPQGWRIIGDNSNGSAQWTTGGAYSGKHCLKLYDRGPFIDSWDKQQEIYLPGGKPNGNYAFARSEVSARWISKSMPVTPGKVYQAMGYVWYARRNFNDRGNANPLRIQFLERDGKVIPNTSVWDDWLWDQSAFVNPGWVPIMTRVREAPSHAVSVQMVVAMCHGFYSIDRGKPALRADDREFVLVDNLMLYPVQTDKPLNRQSAPALLVPKDAFWDTAQANGLPFVPTSPAHRPNALRVESLSDQAGGVILVDRDMPMPQGMVENLSLQIANLVGDERQVHIDYHVLDHNDRKLFDGTVETQISPYTVKQIAIQRPGNLPLGPYFLRFSVSEQGKQTDTGETRFTLITRKKTTPQERGRLDYPFSLWSPRFPYEVGTSIGQEMGQLMDIAGMGKSWFGCNLYLGHYAGIKNVQQRHQAIERDLKKTRRIIAGYKQYGITPMARLEGPHLMHPEQYPDLADTVTYIVSSLKDDIKLWRYGTEQMHGGVKELDKAKHDDGRDYLIWGRQGTVRQYWNEYLVAYKAAKEADSSCLFGPQCASDIEGNVLDLFFQMATKDQIDMFGMNTYISGFAIWPPNVTQLAKSGAPDLPIFISEFAAAGANPTSADHIKQETATSNSMVKYWISLLESFPNFIHIEQWGMILGDDDGSMTYHNRVRPFYAAYANMTNTLGAGRFIQKQEIPGGVIYTRERSVRKGLVGVMWATGNEANAELQVGSDQVTIEDLWGNRRIFKASNGIVQIPLTDQPIYLLDAKQITVAKSVEMNLAYATIDPARPQFKLTLTNHRKTSVSGPVDLLPEGAVALSPNHVNVYALEPGQSKTWTIKAMPVNPELDRRIPIRLRFIETKRTYETLEQVNFHTAVRAARRPKIDGQLNDWPQSPGLIINRADQVMDMSATKPWAGPDDASANVNLMWDRQNLYVAATVVDDVADFAKAGEYVFNHDGFEILFDFDRSFRRDGKPQMITIGMVDNKPVIHRYDGPLPKTDITNARIAITRQDGRTLYEAAIPWRELSTTFIPRIGSSISMCLSLDDGDSGRRCLSWFSHATNKNPAQFGNITFTGALRPSTSSPTDTLKNLLPNGDFDHADLPPASDMKGWNVWHDDQFPVNAEVSLTTQGAQQGRCLYIHRLHNKGNMGVGQWHLAVEPGQIYYFQAMARATRGTVTVQFQFKDKNGKFVGKPAWIKPDSPATTTHYLDELSLVTPQLLDRENYHPISGAFEVPKNGAHLSVAWRYSWVEGDAFIDSAQLYRLSNGPKPIAVKK